MLASSSAGAPRHTPRPLERGFVGRDAVLDQLRGWFDSVQLERGTGVLVRGEPGITFSQTAPQLGGSGIWYARLLEGMHALLFGRFDDATRLAHEAHELGRQVFMVEADLALLTQLLAIRRWQGQAGSLLEPLRKAFEHLPHSVDIRATLASVYVELGRLPDARVEFTRAMVGPSSVVAACQLASVARDLGEAGAAELLYARLLPYEDCCALSIMGTMCHGPVAH